MRKRALRLLVLSAPALYLARRRHERREGVQLYYDDGSVVTLEPGAPELDQLLAVARGVL